jgi:hypothetical protein
MAATRRLNRIGAMSFGIAIAIAVRQYHDTFLHRVHWFPGQTLPISAAAVEELHPQS